MVINDYCYWFYMIIDDDRIADLGSTKCVWNCDRAFPVLKSRSVLKKKNLPRSSRQSLIAVADWRRGDTPVIHMFEISMTVGLVERAETAKAARSYAEELRKQS